MRGYKVMYDYRGKVAGMIVAGAGFITMAIQKLTDFTIIKKLNAAQHFNILLWITIAGLYTMMFSYEKYEDERVKQIRAKSIMIAFGSMFGATLGFAFTLTLMPSMDPKEYTEITASAGDIIEIARMLMFYPAIAVVLYLVIFHIGIYYDKVWDYNDHIGFFENLRKNKIYMVLFIVLALILIQLIFHFII